MPKRPQPVEEPHVKAIMIKSATVMCAVSGDQEFGECAYAMRILPNGVPLLLFQTEDSTSTFLMGEEAYGYTIVPLPYEPAPADPTEPPPVD